MSFSHNFLLSFFFHILFIFSSPSPSHPNLTFFHYFCSVHFHSIVYLFAFVLLLCSCPFQSSHLFPFYIAIVFSSFILVSLFLSLSVIPVAISILYSHCFLIRLVFWLPSKTSQSSIYFHCISSLSTCFPSCFSIPFFPLSPVSISILFLHFSRLFSSSCCTFFGGWG